MAEIKKKTRRHLKELTIEQWSWIAPLLPHPGKTGRKRDVDLQQQRPDILKRRQSWFELQPDLAPERLVFIDETSASTKMARLRGRTARSKRCEAPMPHGH